jgi:hypothetical protein
MRLQLVRAALVIGVVIGTFTAHVAHADGVLSMRGVYYKERSTRVVQPMLDGQFEVGARGLLTGHLLVDAITSASASSGASLDPFTENRYEGGLGYAQEFNGPEDTILDTIRAGLEAKVSKESDYRSVFFGGRVEAELAQKNALVTLGGGASLDNVSNAGAQSAMGGPLLLCDNRMATPTEKECPLNTYALFTSASHLLSPNALVGLSYDLAFQDGFTSNPYRTAILGTSPVAEKHPNQRLRQAVALSGRYYLDRTNTAFIAAYRFYWDDWDIHAHTPELRVVQEVGRNVDAGVRFRYYTQDASFFWQKRYPDMAGLKFWTDDPKMSPFQSYSFEAKLGVLGEAFGLQGRWALARVEGIIEYIIQNNSFGNAVEAHAALTVPFEY